MALRGVSADLHDLAAAITDVANRLEHEVDLLGSSGVTVTEPEPVPEPPQQPEAPIEPGV